MIRTSYLYYKYTLYHGDGKAGEGETGVAAEKPDGG